MKELRIHIGNSREDKYFDADELAFVESDGNYCNFYLKTGVVERTVRAKISDVMKMFNDIGTYETHHLVMAGRSHIFNMECVKSVDKTKRMVSVQTNSLVKVPVSDSAINKLSVLLKAWNANSIFGLQNGSIKTLNTNPYLVNSTRLESYGHEYVDLGLPSGTLWALDNVNGPVIGDVFINHHTNYNDINDLWNDYLDFNEVDIDEREDDEYLVKEDIYKSAAEKWDSHWHKPTREQWNELIQECELIQYTYQGRYGILAKGSNGNYLNLPARNDIDDAFNYHVFMPTLRLVSAFDFITFKIGMNGVKVNFIQSDWLSRGMVRLVLDSSSE